MDGKECYRDYTGRTVVFPELEEGKRRVKDTLFTCHVLFYIAFVSSDKNGIDYTDARRLTRPDFHPATGKYQRQFGELAP